MNRSVWECMECNTVNTPVRWSGSLGVAILCNACGLRRSKYIKNIRDDGKGGITKNGNRHLPTSAEKFARTKKNRTARKIHSSRRHEPQISSRHIDQQQSRIQFRQQSLADSMYQAQQTSAAILEPVNQYETHNDCSVCIEDYTRLSNLVQDEGTTISEKLALMSLRKVPKVKSQVRRV